MTILVFYEGTVHFYSTKLTTCYADERERERMLVIKVWCDLNHT
jgi:hypothetical protein